RLPKRFRDMLPEPPQLLPPANLDNLVPSAPTCDMDGSDPLTIQTLLLRSCQIYQTQLNLFGLFCHYDKETLPAYNPEDTSDDITVSQPTGARTFVSPSDWLLNTKNQFYLYPNKTSLYLGDWYWNQGALKSKVDFKQLLNIIGSPSFRADNIRHTKWALIDCGLGTLTTSDDPEHSPDVTISVPFSQRSANPGPIDYSVPNFYHHSRAHFGSKCPSFVPL
ncbi:hypothetical protein SCLCIDRAFT_107697, partial [Scleroderma citrinum Foug A]